MPTKSNIKAYKIISSKPDRTAPDNTWRTIQQHQLQTRPTTGDPGMQIDGPSSSTHDNGLQTSSGLCGPRTDNDEKAQPMMTGASAQTSTSPPPMSDAGTRNSAGLEDNGSANGSANGGTRKTKAQRMSRKDDLDPASAGSGTTTGKRSSASPPKDQQVQDNEAGGDDGSSTAHQTVCPHDSIVPERLAPPSKHKGYVPRHPDFASVVRDGRGCKPGSLYGFSDDVSSGDHGIGILDECTASSTSLDPLAGYDIFSPKLQAPSSNHDPVLCMNAQLPSALPYFQAGANSSSGHSAEPEETSEPDGFGYVAKELGTVADKNNDDDDREPTSATDVHGAIFAQSVPIARYVPSAGIEGRFTSTAYTVDKSSSSGTYDPVLMSILACFKLDPRFVNKDTKLLRHPMVQALSALDEKASYDELWTSGPDTTARASFQKAQVRKVRSRLAHGCRPDTLHVFRDDRSDGGGGGQGAIPVDQHDADESVSPKSPAFPPHVHLQGSSRPLRQHWKPSGSTLRLVASRSPQKEHAVHAEHPLEERKLCQRQGDKETDPAASETANDDDSLGAPTSTVSLLHPTSPPRTPRHHTPQLGPRPPPPPSRTSRPR